MPRIGLLIVGCCVLLTMGAVTAGDAKTVTVTAKENGKKVELKKGDTLLVRLDANPSTGFTWKITKNDKDILKPTGPGELEKPEMPRPGQKSAMVFRFSADKAGATELELQYARPFEKDKAPAQTFRVSLDVK